jgi:hypothetical protein
MMNFNAVRAIAQDVGAMFTGQMNVDMWITLAGICTGNLITPFLLVFLQWFISKYFSVWVNKAIYFKNPNICDFPTFNKKKKN